MIVVIEIRIAVFVSAPVDNGALYRSDEKVNGQKSIHPPVFGKPEIKQEIQNSEADAHDPAVAETVEQGPGRIISLEGRFGLCFIAHEILVDPLGFHHQSPYVLDKVR